MLLAAGFMISMTALAVPLFAAEEAPVVVGRVYHVEGNLLRYVPSENDWVAAVRDAPFSTGDTLYTANNSMAELVVPNGTLIRIGDNTQIQFMGFEDDGSDIDMASGVARFYNKSSNTVVKATSPFGYILVNPGGAVDFYVGDNSTEVIAVAGNVTFVHASSDARYEMSPGNPSILADQNQVTSGLGGVDPDWDRWNRTREDFWLSRARVAGRSAQYLPPPLRNDAYVFEEHGRWERVYYDGGDRWFWRPTRVATGWAPFTAGRWTEWYGDQTWIPAEPFGYVTHHYGNWIFVRGRWYWAPPVTTATVGLPLLNISFFWYPGRVSWIHSGQYVGWVPLAPRETYYSRYRWGGPHVVHVTNVNITQINIVPRNYAYARHAVIIPQRNLFTVNNYRPVRVTNVSSAAILRNYRGAPIINNTVINNYTTIRERHNFANIPVKEKPHGTVVQRIQLNQNAIQQGKRQRPTIVRENVRTVQEGKINREAKIQQPRVTNYIVPANEINLPKNQIKLQQRDIRKTAQEQPGATPKPAAKPGKAQEDTPSKPSPQIQGITPPKPAPKPEGTVTPPKPGRPSPKPEAVVRDKQAPPPAAAELPTPAKHRPPEKPQITAPTKPAKPEGVGTPKPSPKPEAVAPVRPAPKTERISPPKPARAWEGGGSPKVSPKVESTAPAKPQSEERPKKVTPSKQAESAPPAKKQAFSPVPAKVRPPDKKGAETPETEKPR